MPEQGPGCCDGGPELWAGATTLQDTEGWKELVKAGKILLFDEDRAVVIRYAPYDVSYSDPALRASRFSCQTSAISAGRQRLSEGHHALPGPPDGAGLLLMDPAEVPNQLESRRRAAATTSQLFSAVEDGAPKE